MGAILEEELMRIALSLAKTVDSIRVEVRQERLYGTHFFRGDTLIFYIHNNLSPRTLHSFLVTHLFFISLQRPGVFNSKEPYEEKT